MKKVLVITYYWPPSGKASLHWPLGIIKYFEEYDWEPVILTVENESFTQKDPSLLKLVNPEWRVLKSKAFEPFDIYKNFIGKKKDEQLVASETISRTNQSLAHKISIWIRMNLFVPDARIGWYFSGYDKAEEFISSNKVDAIISIGPPHSVHLIAKRLNKNYKIPYIPIFIDPWVDIVYYKGFKRNPLTLEIDNALEKSVIKNSALTVFVTDTMRKDFIKKYPFIENKSSVLYWGYNEEDFEDVNIVELRAEPKIITHAGNIFDYQNPIHLWENIKKRIDSGEKILIRFIGTVSPEIKNTIIQLGLEDSTEFLGFLPYREMINYLNDSDYLLVCATEKRHVPGKLFEYLRTGIPIIAFGEDNEEVKSIINECNAGMMFSYNENVSTFFDKVAQFKTDLNKVKQYSREIISKLLVDILDKVK
ncbi:MAG: glycosyltransferase [Syntrophothermus sp.]